MVRRHRVRAASGAPYGLSAGLRLQPDVEHDLHGVAHLERTHQPAVGLDAPLALGHLKRPADTAVVRELDGEVGRAGGSGECELAMDGQATVGLLDGAGPEGDGLPAQDLLVDVLADLPSVPVAERLDAVKALEDLQRL